MFLPHLLAQMAAERTYTLNYIRTFFLVFALIGIWIRVAYYRDMIFGMGYKHKLPKFPANVEQIFRSYCEALPDESVPDLLAELDDCVANIKQLADENPRIDLKLVEELENVSRELLSRYSEFNEEGKSLVIGAVRYFAVLDDPVPDEAFASGFVDDAKVMNHVLERIGLEDMIIAV